MVLAYLVQGYVLYAQLKKQWVLGILVSSYFLICMLVYDTVVIFNLQNADFRINYISFTALPMVGIERFAVETRLTFVALSVLTMVASLGGPRRARSSSTDFVAQFASTYRLFLDRNRSTILFGLIVLNALNIAHFFSMDLGLLWVNSAYLAIKTAEEIGITNPLMAIYHEMLRILVLPAILGYFALSGKLQPFAKFLCQSYCLYGFVIMLAGSSRWIALYGVFAILAMQAFGKLTRFRAIVAVAATIVAFEYALFSRSLNYFGLSRVIPNLLELNVGFVIDSIRGVVVNAFEGAINFANGMIVAPNYTQQDQLLSISPLPNFIDGYNRLNGVSINAQAPMGGLGELMFFDPIIQFIAVAFIMTVMRLAYVADRQASAFVRYSITMAATYAIYIFPSYSLRTSWKVFVLIAIGLLAWQLLRKVSPPGTSARRTYRV